MNRTHQETVEVPHNLPPRDDFMNIQSSQKSGSHHNRAGVQRRATKGKKRGGNSRSPSDRVSVVAQEVSVGRGSGSIRAGGQRNVSNQNGVPFAKVLKARTNLLAPTEYL